MEERRRLIRRRVIQSGKILTNHRFSVIDCMIRDLTNEGARLHVASSHWIPDQFHLRMDATDCRGCRVIWRTDTDVGVAFEERTLAETPTPA